MVDSDSNSDEERVYIRRPRNFRPRTAYTGMEETYEYNERFRLDYRTFEYVLDRISNILEHPSARNEALTSKQQLQIALHWLGSGTQYHCVSDMHGVSKATVCRVVHRVVTAIDDILLQDIVRWPADCGEVIAKFTELGNIPLVCGVLDGTLIKIDAPSAYEPAFVYRHGKHSLNVMLVCGPNLEFYYVCANWPGSVSDARVLRLSGLNNKMANGWRPFPGAVLLGDSIYPLKSWLIPPVIQDFASPSQQRFLRAHKKTRRVIECAIGLLKEKFPVLSIGMRLNPTFACKVINACVVLCNLSRGLDNYMAPELEEDHLEEDDIQEGEEVQVQAQEKLQFLYDHFV